MDPRLPRPDLARPLDDDPATDEAARDESATLADRIRARTAVTLGELGERAETPSPVDEGLRRAADLQAKEAQRARARPPEPVRSRAAQLDRVTGLMDRVGLRKGAADLVARFRNFEDADQEELRDMATVLRSFLDEDDAALVRKR